MLNDQRIQEINPAQVSRELYEKHRISGRPEPTPDEAIVFTLCKVEEIARQGGWIAVSSGELPEEEETVDVWIVDDNTAIGGERQEYAAIWDYFSHHPSWKNGLITHWRKRPLPPGETTK